MERPGKPKDPILDRIPVAREALEDLGFEEIGRRAEELKRIAEECGRAVAYAPRLNA